MAENKTGEDGDCCGDESNTTINRSFNAETRHKVASKTKKATTPGLVREKDDDRDHPLLKLEQHLDERQGVGASMKPPRHQGEKIHATKNINDTAEDNMTSKSVDSSKNRASDEMNASKSKPSRDPSSPTSRHETRPITVASPSKRPRSLLGTLLKLLIVGCLLVFWAVLVNSIVSEMSLNDSLDALATKASVELVDIRAKALKTKNMVLTLLSNDDAGVRNLDQVGERIELGRSLLSVYDDAFGSSQYCESAFQGILDVNGVYKSEGPLYLVRMSPQLTEKYTLEETKLVARVLLCMGEARLALFSTSLEPTCSKKGTLRHGKECFEAAVSITRNECCCHCPADDEELLVYHGSHESINQGRTRTIVPFVDGGALRSSWRTAVGSQEEIHTQFNSTPQSGNWTIKTCERDRGRERNQNSSHTQFRSSLYRAGQLY